MMSATATLSLTAPNPVRVNWGDGTIEPHAAGAATLTHTYPGQGFWRVTVQDSVTWALTSQLLECLAGPGPVTGAVAGPPLVAGTWTPPGSIPPYDITALNASSIIPDPATLWPPGAFIPLGNGQPYYWTGTAWWWSFGPPLITDPTPGTTLSRPSFTVSGLGWPGGTNLQILLGSSPSGGTPMATAPTVNPDGTFTVTATVPTWWTAADYYLTASLMGSVPGASSSLRYGPSIPVTLPE